MVTKLTLTIESDVIGSAKKYALKQGRSLSGIVENYLIAITSTEKNMDEISPQLSKMKGVIKLSKDFDYKKTVKRALAKKYGK